MIDIRCTCGETYHADEAFSGQKIKCRKCGAILLIQKQNPSIINDPTVQLRNSNPDLHSTTPTKFNYPIIPKKSILNKENIRRFLILSAIAIIIIGLIFLARTIPADNTKKNRPQSGNIYPDQADTIVSENDTIQTSVDPYADWDKVNLRTGKSPGCLNFKPTYDHSIDNKLEVSVGSNTDVVLKLCDYQTDACIRYVYIRSGSTFNIIHSPEGIYYTKIAYGRDWRQKVIEGQCIGKFVTNSIYKKGDKILDFRLKYAGKSTEGDYEITNYNIPSYSLSLDVIATDFDPNIYHTNSISEEEFNQ